MEGIVAFVILLIVMAGVTVLVLSSTNMNSKADINTKELAIEIENAEHEVMESASLPGGSTGPLDATMTITLSGGITCPENIKVVKQPHIKYFAASGGRTDQEKMDDLMKEIWDAYNALSPRKTIDSAAIDTSVQPYNTVTTWYLNLSPELQEFIDSITLSIPKDGNIRIYFTTQDLKEYPFNETALNNVLVYKYRYQGASGQYQHTFGGTVGGIVGDPGRYGAKVNTNGAWYGGPGMSLNGEVPGTNGEWSYHMNSGVPFGISLVPVGYSNWADYLAHLGLN